jgi:hypothetical protein
LRFCASWFLLERKLQCLVVPDTTLVSDATLGTIVRMSVIDALDAIKHSPSRYSFAAGDPRTLPATVDPHFGESGALLKPTITGAKGGNAAVSSIISALVSLGLVVDTST